MKNENVHVGETYLAKVGTRMVEVRIDRVHPRGGWDAISVASNKSIRVKSAQRLRGPAAKGKSKQTDVQSPPETTQHVAPQPDPAQTVAQPAGIGFPDPDLVPIAQIDRERRVAGKRAAKPKAAKEPVDATPKSMSCLDAAAQVLKTKGEPMRCQEMIAAMAEAKLWSSTAATPHATLYSAILREIATKKDAARFKKTDRGHFTLIGAPNA